MCGNFSLMPDFNNKIRSTAGETPVHDCQGIPQSPVCGQHILACGRGNPPLRLSSLSVYRPRAINYVFILRIAVAKLFFSHKDRIVLCLPNSERNQQRRSPREVPKQENEICFPKKLNKLFLPCKISQLY